MALKKPTLIRPDGAPALSPAQQDCIDVLKNALASAEAGDVTALVVVAVGPSDFGVAFAGSDAPRMNLGLDAAKQTILQRTTGGGGQRSVIHR